MRIGDKGEGWARGGGSVRGCWPRWRVAAVWILCFEGRGMGEVRGDVRSWRCCGEGKAGGAYEMRISRGGGVRSCGYAF